MGLLNFWQFLIRIPLCFNLIIDLKNYVNSPFNRIANHMIISKLKKSHMKICNTLHEIQKNFQETRNTRQLPQPLKGICEKSTNIILECNAVCLFPLIKNKARLSTLTTFIQHCLRVSKPMWQARKKWKVSGIERKMQKCFYS